MLTKEETEIILKNRIITQLNKEFGLSKVNYYSVAGNIANLLLHLYRHETANGDQLLSDLRIGRATLFRHFNVLRELGWATLKGGKTLSTYTLTDKGKEIMSSIENSMNITEK